MDPAAYFATEFKEHAAALEATRQSLQAPFEALVQVAVATIRAGNKILFFGNGGSAADAQHLATELVSRYLLDRSPIAALALTTDSSALTALANDYSYDRVFERQIQALGQPGDLAIGITTSGRSANVTRGLRMAVERGLHAAAFAGKGGGDLAGLADPLLLVPSQSTPRIQEMHILLGHLLCGALEKGLAENPAVPDRPVPFFP